MTVSVPLNEFGQAESLSDWTIGPHSRTIEARFYVEKTHIKTATENPPLIIVQELCESRGGRPALSVLTSLLVSVDVKLY